MIEANYIKEPIAGWDEGERQVTLFSLASYDVLCIVRMGVVRYTLRDTVGDVVETTIEKP